ncbi:MAG: hypothetical protein ACR2QL_01245 [Woeseiaceae bacterium]
MKISVTAGLSALLLLFAHGPLAQAGDADPLFQGHEILQATFEGPLIEFIDKKSKEKELKGTFSVVDTDGTKLEFDLKFRARGNFRHDNCDYPPIRLNFKKGQTKKTLFDKQDKLKLVVHCNRRAQYHQIVLQEYLAYRVLNLLTDLSFRVRLLQIVYSDPAEQEQSPPRYAFLIEHKDRLAHRLDLKTYETKSPHVGLMYPDQLNLSSIFQYFIGNTDFSPVAGPPGEGCCHNYVLFKGQGANITPIPYDFDQSGFVDAPYASPNPNFRIRTVKQRVYRGRCMSNRFIDDSIQKFQDNREAIYELVLQQPGFEDRTRENLVKYVDKFYELVEDPKKVEKQITKKCL